MSQMMNKMPPVFSNQAAFDSSETLIGGAPSLNDLKKWSSQVSDLKSEEIKQNVPTQSGLDKFKSETKKYAKYSNPFAMKKNFLNIFEQKLAKNTMQTDSQVGPGKKHIKRAYAELPLTQESVKTLQSDIRNAPRTAAEVGGTAGMMVGLATGLPIFTMGSIAGGAGVIAAPFYIGTCVAVGAVAGAKIGYSKPKNESKLRLHGFYYTGIVASKAKSEKIVKFLVKNDYLSKGNIINTDKNLDTLADQLMISKLGLGEQEATNAVKYLQFALNGLAVEKE